MKEVIMQVQSFSADYPKAPIYVGDLVRCKDCRWYRDTFLDTKITPTCDRHIDDRYGTLVGGITGDSFCSYGERREPKGFTADEWHRDTFKGEEE